MASRMTETGYQWGIKALQKRRAEIAGNIADLALQLRHRRRDLAKVDEVLHILAPGSDPSSLPAKRFKPNVKLFRQGELNRLLVGVLRANKAPMTNQEIVTVIIQDGGFSEAIRTTLKRRVRGNLAYLESLGRVRRVGSGNGIDTKWALKQNASTQLHVV